METTENLDFQSEALNEAPQESNEELSKNGDSDESTSTESQTEVQITHSEGLDGDLTKTNDPLEKPPPLEVNDQKWDDPELFSIISNTVPPDDVEDVNAVARDIINHAVKSASLCYQSSGDFSFLTDAPLKKVELKSCTNVKKNGSDPLDGGSNDRDVNAADNNAERENSETDSNSKLSVEPLDDDRDKATFELDTSGSTLRDATFEKVFVKGSESEQPNAKAPLSETCVTEEPVETVTVLSDDKKCKEDAEDWMDVTGSNSIRKKVLITGQESTRPQRNQEVTVEIESFCDDGSVIEEIQTLQFVTFDYDVPEAVDMGVSLMDLNEKCMLRAKVEYCRPKDGRLIDLPSDGEVIYIITLQDISDGPYDSSMSIDRRLAWADRKKNIGNIFYNNKQWDEAKRAYAKCIKVLEHASRGFQDEQKKRTLNDLMLKSNNNLAGTLIKLNEWHEALSPCMEAERLDRNNIKTLYRKGKIYSKLGRHFDAIVTFKKALSLRPEDKEIQSELKKEQKRLVAENEAERKLYQRMLQVDPKPTNNEDSSANKKSWLSSGSLLKGSLVVLGSAVLLGIYMMHK